MKKNSRYARIVLDCILNYSGKKLTKTKDILESDTKKVGLGIAIGVGITMLAGI